MNYGVINVDKLKSTFDRFLSLQLHRLDIRAVINGKENPEELTEDDFRNSRKAYDVDCQVIIGERFNLRKVNQKTKTVFFSTSLKRREKNIKADRKFSTIPRKGFEYVGCHLNDEVKNHDFSDSPFLDIQSIGLLTSEKSIMRLLPVIKEIGNYGILLPKHLEGKFNSNGKNIQFQHEFDVLKNANIVLIDNNEDSLKAALLNCPQVFIDSRSIIDKITSQKAFLIVNDLIKGEFLRSFFDKRSLKFEIKRLLNDHEYYASFVSEYHQVKEILGAESTARNLASEIVEYLEK